MKKQCKHCKKDFTPPHFNSKYCSISCKMHLYGKRYRERIKRYNHKYYGNNKEKYQRLWSEYYQTNRDTILTRSKKRYYFLKKNRPDLVQKWNRISRIKYRQTEGGKLVHRLDSHRRRCLGRIDKQGWLEKLKSFGGKCAKCGSSEKITIDHIIPISKGGTNDTKNLQPLCGHCNYSKGDRI